jgi:hypothetical protein
MISTNGEFGLCGKGKIAESSGCSQPRLLGRDENIGATVTLSIKCCAMNCCEGIRHGVLRCDGFYFINAEDKMEGTFWAFMPAIIAIVLALVTKQVYISLFLGILFIFPSKSVAEPL